MQEPYVGKAGILKQYPGTKVIQCTLNRQKPVKAAVIVFGDQLEVIHDPQLVTETEAAVLLVAGRLKIGVVSVYYEGDQEIDSYLRRTQTACQSLGTDNLIVGGDINAWSPWWGSESENPRGAAYTAFLNSMDLHILNTGNVPTFETHRGDRLCTSIVDVTACSESLLGKIDDWRVNRSMTTSDHNAITFTLQLETALVPLKRSTTRRYNTKKARWSDFATLLRESLVRADITPENINRVESPEELEDITEKYITIIQEACDYAIPQIKPGKASPKPPWWSKDLELAKADVKRKKRRIRNAAKERRQLVINEYLDAKTKYKEMANNAATESWKDFCTAQERESMWDGVYRVIRKTARRNEDMLLRDTGGKTLSPEGSAELLAKTFYPDDLTTTDTPFHTHLREKMERDQESVLESLSENDPPFTTAELESVLSELNPKKAPGPDGLTSDICTKAIHCGKEVFMAIANKCLTLPHFPKQWKMAHVVILRKPGKDDYTHPKSYRPIGLLSVLGKIVEKLMVGRLQWRILPTLNKAQYGFMPQRGTEDALYDLVSRIRSELKLKKIVIVISLDIEGAFDNAWWPALKNQLATRKCPKNLYGMVSSYLRDRKVKVNYAGAEYERSTTKGCVQGSIGGPTFWNLLLDSLLQKLTGAEVHCQAFADDVVLVFSGHKIGVLEQTANTTLAEVVEWGKRNKLNFAAHKTNAMVITKKLKYEPPRLYMSNNRLQIVNEIKLLGLIIDKNLTFQPHIAAVSRKTAEIYKQLACAAKVTWGLNREIIRTIYVAVIEPIVLYASSVWYPATELQMVRSLLDTIQRGYAQKICKAHRTVSLTSALIISGLLPLDIRVQEAASLYLAKKNLARDYIPPGRELEQWVHYLERPHPAKLRTTEYELLEKLDSETVDSHHITGPLIYTDGSKIEGKVGAALTWWENDKETANSTFRLDPACTVFQAELFALHKAVQQAHQSGHPVVNIMSDSRSSLELLGNPKLTHPLVKAVRETLEQLKAEERELRFFWIRAHIGTPGNERADELAKVAAYGTEEVIDYNKIPLSYVKRRIREESVKKWQARYSTSQTGKTTKTFFPDVKNAYSILRKIEVTPTLCQAFTGHGGISEYLFRFKLKDSPACECDPEISETVEHIIVECPRFSALRMDTEYQVNKDIHINNLHILIADAESRPAFLRYLETIFRIASERNKNPTPPSSDSSRNTPVPQPLSQSTGQPNPMQTMPNRQFLLLGEKGKPGIRTRGVALFMDNSAERLGISFCVVNDSSRSVMISPGLAALMNGSTSKTTIRRKVYDALPETAIGHQRCRILHTKNKIIAIFRWELEETPFGQASSALTELCAADITTARIISMDAMVVCYEKGKLDDYLGCINASKKHEVVVYENRGEDLSFLKPTKSAPSRTASGDKEPHSATTSTRKHQSGAERLTQEREETRDTAGKSLLDRLKQSRAFTRAVNTIGSAIRSISGEADKKAQEITTSKVCRALENFITPKPPQGREEEIPRTLADKGIVEPPVLRDAQTPKDHTINAFLEYIALVKAELEVSKRICDAILQSFYHENASLLKVRLEEAEAVIYDNETQQILQGDAGELNHSHMAAYSATAGFVDLEEEATKEPEKPRFKTTSRDNTLVIAKCTRIMLGHKTINQANSVAGEKGENLGKWQVPNFTWVNGVPGCGKTTWIIRNFDKTRDVVITGSTEAKNDLREKLAAKHGAEEKAKVRTMASVLANGFKEQERASCERLIVDEALMNHLGSIILATKLADASETLLIGDENQVPFIDRINAFALKYSRPSAITSVTKQLLCTHRNPMDVAYALNQVYDGIYASKSRIRSMVLKGYTGATIQKDTNNTLYLTHTQREKTLLKSMGYGTGQGSQVNTIHEAQGLTFENVVIVRTTERKTNVHDEIPHAIVAVSRHTISCTYYTDDITDAIAQLLSRASSASLKDIREYNIKMAIRDGNEEVARRLMNETGYM